MVYVDDMEAPFGRMLMCHMIADSTQELLAMADSIGVSRRWIQKPGTHQEHFDICKAKRAVAVKRGAVELTMKELATITWNKRPNANGGDMANDKTCKSVHPERGTRCGLPALPLHDGHQNGTICPPWRDAPVLRSSDEPDEGPEAGNEG